MWYILIGRELLCLGVSRQKIFNENDSYEVKKEKFMSVTNHSDKSLSNKQGQEYMSDPNTIKFTDTLINRAFNSGGRPMAFKSVETLESDIREFLQLCYDTSTIPTVSSAGMWLGCDRDTIYNHANNSNSPFFGTCKKLIDVCQVAMENGAIKGKVNAVLYMFLGKNYFGLKDDKNIQISAQQGSNINTQETADALRKQIEEETVPNADVKID